MGNDRRSQSSIPKTLVYVVSVNTAAVFLGHLIQSIDGIAKFRLVSVTQLHAEGVDIVARDLPSDAKFFALLLNCKSAIFDGQGYDIKLAWW